MKINNVYDFLQIVADNVGSQNHILYNHPSIEFIPLETKKKLHKPRPKCQMMIASARLT
ncbi:MAG: hypothetical protein FWE25_08395 [Lachnospiraceae bacterium]|nr:hypothetical protein [Lachnospiraceae bacterium]